ncbi:hypothetical protein [Ruegeria atlantica]|nr:hypothetical protein [Ruegeria atlantica]CUH42034.1 hypothetical protein RUM4293_00919 [Ruegeria atlantica]
MKVICYICAMAFAGAAFAQDNMVEGRPMTSAEMGIMQDTPPNRTIDISAWDKGPDNRWAFQHISEFLHVANISRGSGPAAPLALALQDLSDLQFDGLDGQPMTVADMLVRT